MRRITLALPPGQSVVLFTITNSLGLYSEARCTLAGCGWTLPLDKPVLPKEDPPAGPSAAIKAHEATHNSGSDPLS